MLSNLKTTQLHDLFEDISAEEYSMITNMAKIKITSKMKKIIDTSLLCCILL
jgi:hypothetical protein